MKVELLDRMGTDMSVVNAARVSFSKESKWERCPQTAAGCDLKECEDYNACWSPYRLSEKDQKLIGFLAREKHFTPFTHCVVTFRVKAPIFVARQLWKHHVGLSGGDYGPVGWNEVSRRYVDEEPEFYIPETWRKRAENVKQGSSDEEVEVDEYWIPRLFDELKNAYEVLLEAEICPEQARMILPQSTYTEWWWTGSIAAFARICNLRLDQHAQKETQEVAQEISKLIEPNYPVSWKELMK